MSRSQVFQAVVAAARDFAGLRLWERFDNDECLALAIPGEAHVTFASIMGQAGEEYGLTLFRGKRAKDHLFRLLQGDGELDEDLLDEIDQIGFSMTTLREIPPEQRDLLRKAKIPFVMDAEVPFFIAKEPHRLAREIDARESLVFLYVLSGITEAWNRGLIVPVRLAPDVFLPLVRISGDPRHPEVVVERENITVTATPAPALVVMPPPALAALPRLKDRWLVGLPHLSAAIENDPRPMRVLLVMNEKSTRMIHAEAVMSGELPITVQHLFAVFTGGNHDKVRGLPRGVIFASRLLFDAVSPALTHLGVACSLEPDHPLLQQVSRHLAENMGAVPPERELIDDAGPSPGSSNLEAWKKASLALSRRVVKAMESDGLPNAAAMKRYFGDLPTAERMLGKYGSRGCEPAFLEWLVIGFRRSAKSVTVAETLLSSRMPAAERVLLEAELAAVPSIYKVVEIHRGDSLLLEDLLRGGRVRVHDRSLSETATEGLCLPALVYPAGNFHLLFLLGPSLDLSMVADAVEYFEKMGFKQTPEGIKKHLHLFGHLWMMYEARDKRAAVPRQMANFDGDPLVLHTASYRVADRRRVREALTAREDVDFDEAGNCFIWNIPSPHPEQPIGDTVTAADISFVGDELIVKVNSAKRLKRVRAWLDKISGLDFDNVTKQDLSRGQLPEVPPDDRPTPSERAPMTPDMVEAVNEHLRDHYLKWLDVPLPALDGHTPRHACRTQTGKRKVALLIRTMSDPGGAPGLKVPREEMLRALGLE